MLEEKPKFAFILLLVGSVLIFTNALLVGINGGPLMISSGAVQSLDDVLGNDAGLWYRISFGFKGLTEGAWTIFWLITAIVIFYFTIRFYINPIERKILCPVIAMLSIMSFFYGGGFILGSILAFLGAGIGYAWPVALGKAFFYKLVQAAKLDSGFFENLKTDEDNLKHGVYSLVFASILAAVGIGLYTRSAQAVLNSTSLYTPFATIILGDVPLSLSIMSTATINVGMAILKWITLSLIIYLIGASLIGRKHSFSSIAAVTGFAYIPVSLQVFVPFIFTSVPYLSFTWPFLVTVITNAWMILILVAGVRRTLEISLNRAVGILAVSGAIYILLLETFFSTLTIPDMIQFTIQPQIILLVIVSVMALGSIILGTFNKR
jgi:hypothetical protein